MIFSKKELSYEEKIDRQKKKLKTSKIKTLCLYFVMTLGIFGGIGSLVTSNNTEDNTEEVSEMLVNNEVVKYIRDYYNDEEIIVSDIVIDSIKDSKDKIMVVSIFKLNDTEVSSDITLDHDYNVVSEIVLNTPEVKEEYVKEVNLDTVENLNEEEKINAIAFLNSFFESMNSNNATVFYSDAKPLSENTSYDIETLELVDSGTDSTNLYQTYVRIDYVYYDEEGNELYRDNQDIVISYNFEQKIITNIEY